MFENQDQTNRVSLNEGNFNKESKTYVASAKFEGNGDLLNFKFKLEEGVHNDKEFIAILSVDGQQRPAKVYKGTTKSGKPKLYSTVNYDEKIFAYIVRHETELETPAFGIIFNRPAEIAQKEKDAKSDMDAMDALEAKPEATDLPY